ncbi:hypothetical protein TIFTF001_023230 [Ficus carica]|uniref:Uncharacterized protein n=1 Tax=Ficus carica TaxID=3494 RepID=A0AA88AN62_FICCA|nr:hypothetical protein TIFTF001_023230 [Ficus carica]
MKVGFALANPTVIGVDWSFVPEVSGDTVVEEGQAPEAEEGEVTGGANVAEEVVILDEPEQTTIPDQFTIPEQPTLLDHTI